MITSVQDLLDDNGEEFPGTKVARFLNIAANEVQNIPGIKRYLFPTYTASLTMTQDVGYVSLPSGHNYDVQQVIYNPGSSQRVLRYVDFQELPKNDPQTVLFYSVRGDRIYLSGTPNSTDHGVSLGVFYSITDTQVANDGNETTLGLRAPFCLIYRAAQLLLIADNPDAASASDRYGRLFDESLQRVLEEAEEKSVADSKYAVDTRYPDAL